MIEKIKDLEGTTIFFDSDNAIDVIGYEDAKIISVKILTDDDNQFGIIELDKEAYLVMHNFDNDTRYFAYQILDSGDAENLEQDGYYFLTDDQDFRNKIVFRDDVKSHVYKHSEVGAVYMIDDEENEMALCEYVSNSHEMSSMLILKNEDELLILQGIEIYVDEFTIDGIDAD